MKGDFSRASFRERKHYRGVLLQQGRVQLDADWNEAEAIRETGEERALRDLVGACGSPNAGFQIAARRTLDPMDSAGGWTKSPRTATVCVDYVDYLRGPASLRATQATEIVHDLGAVVDLSTSAALTFAVKSATPPPLVPPIPANQKHDSGYSFFVVDTAGKRAAWLINHGAPQIVGLWRVYTCPTATPTTNAGVDFTQVQSIGFTNLKPAWVYHFDAVQCDFAPVEVALRDFLALEALEDLTSWSVPSPGTGTVGLDGTTLFDDAPTVQITGSGDGFKTLAAPRNLSMYSQVRVVATDKPDFFLRTARSTAKKRITLTQVGSASGPWRSYAGSLPAGDPDLAAIVGYGIAGVASGKTLNVAQVLVQLETSGSFFILGGDRQRPGRLYVDGIACQKEATETYYNQADYPAALPLVPADNRVDLVYADVWQRHVTCIEDPELREVALAGPDTCTRLRTVAQVKVLRGGVDTSTAALRCRATPAALRQLFEGLARLGAGRLSTLVSPPSQPSNLCEIAPDADYLGLDNRLYRVEVHDPTLAPPTFKWSRDNGAQAVAVVADVLSGQNPQMVSVERLGRDRATTIARGDLVEVSDDLTDLADASYGLAGPVKRTGELRIVKDLDPDANTITLDQPLGAGYTVARHAKVRRWEGSGDAAAFVDSLTTPQLDFGDGVRVTFNQTAGMVTGDYWQFTARGITGQVEQLDGAAPAGVIHHYCPLALIKWKSVAGRLEIVDIADCRAHLPALTELDATDVGYDDGCCGLTDDARMLAAWDGDLTDARVTNVQQAIDLLCARESEYLTLRYVSGDGQDGLPGEQLPTPLVVAVENALGEPQSNVVVSFTIDATAPSRGTLTAASPTDSKGEARVTWILGQSDGLNRVTATLATPQASSPEVIFNARTLAALTLRYVSGDGQEGSPGQPLGTQLIVAVDDARGNPKSGVQVKFGVTAGNGTASTTAAVTNASGEASVTWTLGPSAGLNLLEAGLAAPPALAPEQIIFNARGSVRQEGCCCTITVGDGNRSHGDFRGQTLDGFAGLKAAMKLAQDLALKGGSVSICILAGTFSIDETIVIGPPGNARLGNVVVSGQRAETVLRGKSGQSVFSFIACDGVELRDVWIVSTDVPAVLFEKCNNVTVEAVSIQAIAAPRGVLLLESCAGATIVRNNLAPTKGGPVGGIVIADFAASVLIAENDVSAIDVPALSVAGAQGATATVRDNRLTYRATDSNATRSMLQVSAPGAAMLVGNTLRAAFQVSPTQAVIPIQVESTGHVAFNSNYCACSGTFTRVTHVLLDAGKGKSAAAAGNHCIEDKSLNDQKTSSLLLKGPESPRGLAAAGNVTTNGVTLSPADPSGIAANVAGVVI
jgi:hypothetical protein